MRELFPEARSYLDVYARAGLLHARSVFAHGIWLDDADRAALPRRRRADRALPVVEPVPRQRPVRLARRARRPASRSCAGDRRRRRHQPVDAAHAWPTPTRCRRCAGQRLTAWKALHAATRGAARALGLADEIGSLDAGARRRRLRLGCRPSAPVATRRAAVARTLHERVFAWMTLADERNLVETFVAGRAALRSQRRHLSSLVRMLRLELVDISKRTRP